LKDETDVPFLHGQIIYTLISNEKVSFGRYFQTSNHTQNGGFAAATGAE
jgi:hypothetical protein